MYHYVSHCCETKYLFREIKKLKIEIEEKYYITPNKVNACNIESSYVIIDYNSDSDIEIIEKHEYVEIEKN